MSRSTRFELKSGDTNATLRYTVRDRDGNPIDLSSVTGVVFSMDAPDGSSVVSDASATIESAADGEVSYQFQAGDTATTGEHTAEFKVNYSDGTVSYHPYDHDITVDVEEAVN